jgi:hypothetical protein
VRIEEKKEKVLEEREEAWAGKAPKRRVRVKSPTRRRRLGI